MIHDAGGIAVVAHPFWDVADPDDVRALVESLELEVEAFYPSHSRAQTEFCLKLCAQRDRLTGSSDFQGRHKTFSRFGAFDTFGLGEPQVPPKQEG